MPQPASIICLLGPTASGKSDLALQLADELPVEIVSVDSAQVYRGMDIGTAKPDAATQARVPHHLIDICDPSESYSAAQFCQDAKTAIDAILQRDRIPLLVGGTMLYFRALQFGLAPLPEADATIRSRLEQEAQQHGWPALHARLKDIDPVAATRIHPHDQQRLQRALEVYEISGKPLSELQTTSQQYKLPYPSYTFGLTFTDRHVLHQRIETRLQQMFTQGFIDEVRALYERGDLHPDLPAIKSVGYRQVWQYLAGEYDKTTLHERALFATRQFAKRQLTWLRSWPNIQQVDAQSPTLKQQILKALEST